MGDNTPKSTDKRLANLRPPWKKGESGNPKGRPKTLKNLINESFLRDLNDCWNKNGIVALQELAEKDPASFVRVTAALLPKEININEGEVSIERLLEQYDPEQLDKLDAEISTLITSRGDNKTEVKARTTEKSDSVH